MEHEHFRRIAAVEISAASQADGAEYGFWSEAADYGNRVRFKILEYDKATSEERVLCRTGKDIEELPVLSGLSEADAVSLVREFLSVARRNRAECACL